MTKRDVLSVALRIIGVLTLMSGLVYIPVAFLFGLLQSLPGGQFNLWYYVTTFSTLLVNIIVAFLLLRYADKIAGKFVRVDKELDIGLSADWDNHALLLAIRIVGVVTVIKGLVKLAQTTHIFTDSINYAWPDMPLQWDKLLAPCILILVGVYLIYGGGLIIRWAFRAPRIRISETIDSPEPQDESEEYEI